MRKFHFSGIISKLCGAVLVLLLICSVRAAAPAPTLQPPERPRLIQEGGFRLSHAPSAALQADPSDPWDIYLQRLDSALQNAETVVMVDDLNLAYTQENLNRLFHDAWDYINVHPEYFYAIGPFDHTPGVGIFTSIMLEYDETLLPYRAPFEEKVNEILSLIEPQMTVEEQLLTLHDYLDRTITYDWEVSWLLDQGEDPNDYQLTHPNVYNVVGALLEQNAVCNGYSMAYKVLMDRLGIENDFGRKPGHIWNVVKIGDNWYHIDATWDDPTPNIPGYAGYKHFLIPEEEMAAYHRHSSQLPAGITCTDRTYMSKDWAFRQYDESRDHPVESQLQYYNGAYYELRLGREDSGIYRWDSLRGTPVSLIQDPGYLEPIAPGNVRVQNHLYYYVRNFVYGHDHEYFLHRLDLNTGATERLAMTELYRSPSADGMYTNLNDKLGMCLNQELSRIEFWSSTRPLSSHVTFPAGTPLGVYSLTPTATVDDVSCQTDPSQVLVHATCTDGAENGARLLAAFYQGEQLLAVRLTDCVKGTELYTVEAPDAWSAVRCFILDAVSNPACPAVGLTLS